MEKCKKACTIISAQLLQLTTKTTKFHYQCKI